MDIKELLESVDKVKVSVVMQVNLQDYKGSRESAIDKFLRAVDSFKNQIYKNCELVIVSDGCNKSYQIYNRHFKNDESIRFVYYDRSDKDLQMYQTKEGDPEEYKYYRGFARKLGVAASTGDIITYMDSDDVIAPEFTMTQMLVYNQEPENDWWINTSWYDNAVADWKESEQMFDIKDSEEVELSYIHDKWRAVKMKPGMFVMGPHLLLHKANLNVYWRDTYGTLSEDVDFNTRLRAAYPTGNLYSSPIYARCHCAGKWDI